jgi:hypothetical protein
LNKPIEIRAYPYKRSEIIIANFVEGYASGWAFAVHDSFREALDIRLSNKKISNYEIKVWTQGSSFRFKIGDTLYNHRLAYDNFAEFLQGVNPIALQVQNATDSGYLPRDRYRIIGEHISYTVETNHGIKENSAESFSVLNERYDGGHMRLIEYRPNKVKNKLVETNCFELRQDEFVLLLQQGVHRVVSNNRITNLDFSYNIYSRSNE